MTQEFVTLPREVVERAIDALYCTDSEEGSPAYNFELKAVKELRAALEQPDHSGQSYMEGVTAGRHELASEYPLPTDLYDSKDWRCGTYAERVEWLHTMHEDAREQIAALEQPQNHVPDAGNMVLAGWKLVPVEPTNDMLYDIQEYSHILPPRGKRIWAHMLAAAPKPPTTEQPSAAQQPQVEQEQEPVAWIWAEWSSRKLTFDGPPAVPSVRDELTKPAWTPLYTRPQRERQPLSTARIDELIEEGIFGGNPYELVRRLEEERGVFMTRPLTDEVIKDIHGAIKWHEFGSGLAFARAIEAAHNIK